VAHRVEGQPCPAVVAVDKGRLAAEVDSRQGRAAADNQGVAADSQHRPSEARREVPAMDLVVAALEAGQRRMTRAEQEGAAPEWGQPGEDRQQHPRWLTGSLEKEEELL